MDIPNIFITSETKFYVIALDDLIKQIGEDSTKRILSFFECPQNKDVEDFLRYKAIEFSKQRLAKTYLVYWATIDYREKELVGYFTVSLKQISIDKKDLSNTKRKAYKKYAISCFLKQGGSMKVKVREAIRKALRYGSFVLYTGNGTQIRLLDTCNSPYDCIGKIKVVKGERIYRDIFCAVIKAPET